MLVHADRPADRAARARIRAAAAAAGFDLAGAHLLRTSSRLCLSVEHGDYNGTPLFGIGTDRCLWIAAKPRPGGEVRFLSIAFAGEGIVRYRAGAAPSPSPAATGWGRYARGADWVLRRAGHRPRQGFDAIVDSDIPGGGMSRSAALSLNLLLTVLRLEHPDADLEGLAPRMQFAQWGQAVEADYAGVPCGILDPLIIAHARADAGVWYEPGADRAECVPLPAGAEAAARFVALDTGVARAGLEHSTYPRRRAECERLVRLAQPEFGIRALAEVRDGAMLAALFRRFAGEPKLCARLAYVFTAQLRLPRLLAAWRAGDWRGVGRVLRADGVGLRDLYRISGPELEAMCSIARGVPGVYGERMLGGGDAGAAGAIVRPDAVEELRCAVAREYPRRHPAAAPRAAVHELQLIDGIAALAPL